MIKIDDVNLGRIKEILSSLEKEQNAVIMDEICELKIILATLERMEESEEQKRNNSWKALADSVSSSSSDMAKRLKNKMSGKSLVDP